MTALDLDQRAIATIRTLAMDAVQAAGSGHPGTPMAMAPAAYRLWHSVLRFDPEDPIWPNRDRFVLSIGHASMLLQQKYGFTPERLVEEAKAQVARARASSGDPMPRQEGPS